MSTLATIPPDDLPDFSRFPEECRREVQQLLRVMARLIACAGRGIGAAIKSEACRLEMGAGTLRRIYDDFRKTGDWRVLLDRRKFPEVESALPAAFLEFWKKRAEENQRKSKPAYRLILRQWRAWRAGDPKCAIPGYAECPPETGHGHPAGWSYRNLLRYLPAKAELVAMRDGLGAALGMHVGKVLTTRQGLWVGAQLQIDDVLRDFKVMVVGKQAVGRIQELGVLDVYSGDRFAVHRRPQWMDADGRKDSLKEAEMRFLIAAVFRNNGYSPRGTEIVAEHGTATVRPALQEFLARYSDGKITVRRSGMIGKEQVIAGYWGSGGGNPRHKPHLESHHNLLHNEAASLPAATGHDRREPEWLHGVTAITRDVLKSLATLPADRAELLIAPMCEYWQGVELLRFLDECIAWRTDHELEGWVKCGHVVTEYRIDVESDHWLTTRDLLALPGPQQNLLATAALADSRYRRTRKLAPREVHLAGSRDLIRLPDHVIALLFCDQSLGVDLRVEKSLRPDGRFHLQHELAEVGEMEFLGVVQTPHGEELALKERAAYGVVLNPFDAGQLWVYGPEGQYLGTAKRVERVCQLDTGSLQRALGQHSHELSALLTPLRERHAGTALEIRRLQEHNAAVRSGAPVTAQEKERAREHARIALPPDAFLTPEADRASDDDAAPDVKPLSPSAFL
jgi:hypothetical protein